jgi:serine-type D-Ala-D-Ala carboxypeptidase
MPISILTPLLALLTGLLSVGALPPEIGSPSAFALTRADSLVAAWVAEERVPGAVLLVSRGDRVLLERAYGSAQLYEYGTGQYGDSQGGKNHPDALRRLDDPPPMTSGTVFDLASVTKVMATTFAVMMLVDEGALDLEAPLHSYLPDFRGGAKDRITLRHLLTHRAGLEQWKPTYYHATTPAEAYTFIRDLPLAWEVGEARHYSDLGFMLLGLTVEKVTGGRLDAFLQERLYGPLGLDQTGFRPISANGAATGGPSGPFAATSHGNPFERRMVYDSTFGYRISGDPTAWNGWRRRTLLGEVNDGNSYHAFRGVAGHAGLFSTAADLQVLLQLLLNRGRYDGRRYISAEVVDRFLESTGNDQALGWQTPGYAPPTSFAHTGFTGTFVWGVSKLGLGVVLLTNRQNLGVDAGGSYSDVGPLQRAVVAALAGGG